LLLTQQKIPSGADFLAAEQKFCSNLQNLAEASPASSCKQV